MNRSALTLVVDHPPLELLPHRPDQRARGVPAHVTVLYPWRPAPLRARDVSRAAAVVRDFGPMTLAFDEVAWFPQGVVYLALADEDRARQLCRLVQEEDEFGMWSVRDRLDL